MLLVALVDDRRVVQQGLLDDPLHGLAGVHGPQLHQVAVRAVLAVLDELAHQVLDVGRVARGEVDAGARVALGDGHALLLEQRDRRARLAGGKGGGNARGAGADDHDVVIVGLGDIGDRLGLDEEARNAVAQMAGRGAALHAGSLLGVACRQGGVLARACRERAGANDAKRRHATELQQVTTADSS